MNPSQVEADEVRSDSGRKGPSWLSDKLLPN